MITTEQLKKLAPIVCPETEDKNPEIWQWLWTGLAAKHADTNPPVIADKAALNAAFGIGEMK